MNPEPLMLLASILLGAAVALFVFIFVHIMTMPRRIDPALGRFEVERRSRLREGSWTYRNFEPWVDQIAAASKEHALEERVASELTAAGIGLPWRPAEHLAVNRVESILAALAVTLAVWLFSGYFWALVFGGLVLMMWPKLALRSLRSKAERRRVVIKRRLGSGIDLMALMMEVGGNFQEALLTVTRNSENHPLGDELTRVIKDIESGRPRRDALMGFGERLGDDDATDIVFSIVKGEELGTPLATILRIQADQMRQKRSQWAEKASQEAQVSLVFPAMVIMVACLIIVAAPFILSTLFAYQGS